MNYDDIYYKAISLDETSPISWGVNTYRVKNFHRDEPLVVDSMLYAEIDEDEEPLLGDYHSLPKPVFSERAKGTLDNFSLLGNQLFPITITHNDTKHPDYFILNCHNELMAMHRERSKFQKEGLIFYIDSLSLNEEVLDKIPEEERMIFVLEEKAAMILYHEKIVKALEAAEVTGVRFVKVSEWGIGSAFD